MKIIELFSIFVIVFFTVMVFRYFEKPIIEYRVIEKEYSSELFVDIQKCGKQILEVRKLDNAVDGKILVIYQ
jgi:hypothetical protein